MHFFFIVIVSHVLNRMQSLSIKTMIEKGKRIFQDAGVKRL